MSRKLLEKRYQRTRAKEMEVQKETSPILLFCLFDEIDVRQTIFDSANTFHKHLMAGVGKIALISYNMPLNGRELEFRRILSDSKFLILHSDDELLITKKDLNHLIEIIKYGRKQSTCLKIFSTPKVARVMEGHFNFIKIDKVCEIVKLLNKKKG